MENRIRSRLPTTLVQICLDRITDYFADYIAYYWGNGNLHFKRTFELARKVYSDELMLKLTSKNDGDLDPKYLSFMLSEYLTFLRVSTLGKCNPVVVLQRLSEVGHGIKNLNFRSSNIAKFGNVNEFLVHVRNVEVLDCWVLTESRLSETLKVITEKCPKLKEFRYPFYLRHFLLIDFFSALLREVPSIEILDWPYVSWALYKNHIEDQKAGSEIVRTYNLTYLKNLNANFLGLPDISYNSLISLCSTLCPKIEILDLEIYEECDLYMLSSFPLLKSVMLRCTLLLDVNPLTQLQLTERLKQLYLSNAKVSLINLSMNCPRLQRLLLKDVKLDEDCAENFVPFSELEDLHIISTSLFKFSKVSEILNGLLRNVPKLKSLKLQYVTIEDDFEEHLASFPFSTVERLHFKSCDITIDYVREVLSRCTVLETILIENCKNIRKIHKTLLKEVGKHVRIYVKNYDDDDYDD